MFIKWKEIFESSLFRSAYQYAFANIFSAIIQFFILIVLSRFLSPESFGVVGVYIASVAILSALMTFGLNGAVSRFYFDFDKNEFNEFVGSCMIFIFFIGFISCLVFYVFGDLLAKYINLPIGWVWVLLVNSLGQAIFSLCLSVFQVRNLAKLYSLQQIAQVAISAFISIILVVVLGYNWQGRILAQVMSTCVTAAGVVYYLFKDSDLIFKINFIYIKQALRYGLPLVVHVLSGVVLSSFDRLIIAHFLNLKDAGYYMVAGQLTAAFIFFIDAFNRAYAPWLFDRLSNRKEHLRLQIVYITYGYFVVVFLGAVVFAALLSYLMILIMGNKYEGSVQYILSMSLAASFMGMYYMVTLFLQYAKRTEYLAVITMATSLISVTICFMLVNSMGAIGAAYAQVLSQFLMFIITWYVSMRVFPMPWFKVFSHFKSPFK